MNVERPPINLERLPPSVLPAAQGGDDRRLFPWIPLLLGFLRRRWPIIALCCVLALGAALAYRLTRPPVFVATTELLVDMRQGALLRQQSSSGDPNVQSAHVDSQVGILRSAGVARAVVLAQGLAEDPELAPAEGAGAEPAASPILAVLTAIQGAMGEAKAAIERLLGLGADDPVPDQVTLATERLMQATTVRRVGLSHLVNITVEAEEPEQAARLANALAEAYLVSQLGAGQELRQRASNWMEERVTELQQQAVAADRAAQEYRVRNNIIGTERGLLYEQQLDEFSSQLTEARAQRAQAEANWSRARAAVQAGRLPTEMSNVIASPTISSLREREAEALRRVTEFSSSLGRSHPDLRAAEAELVALRGQILQEARRISSSLASVVEAAREREAELEQRLAELASVSSDRNADRIALRALESSALAYRRLHDSFLERYAEVVQDQTFPISDARIVTEAQPPIRGSGPRLRTILLVGLAFGLALGFALAFTREALDRGLRTAAQVRAATGMDCIGLLPRIRRFGRGGRKAAGGMLPEASAGTVMPVRTRALRHVVAAPYAPYSEAVRALALRIAQPRMHPHGVQVIGLVAATTGTGTSTLAANLAHTFALQGRRTLLMDWHLRGSGKGSLTRSLVPRGWIGFHEAVEDEVPVAELLWRDSETGLRFLPSAGARPLKHPADIIGSARALSLMTQLRSEYDIIVVDLPCLASGADAQVAQHLVDASVVNLEWGAAPPGGLLETLARLEFDNNTVLGVVLNKANLAAAERYGAGETALVPARYYAGA